MNTVFLLMAQYGMPIIPIEWVCRDYFRHLTVEKFLRKPAVANCSDVPVAEPESRACRGERQNHLQ